MFDRMGLKEIGEFEGGPSFFGDRGNVGEGDFGEGGTVGGGEVGG
jgi:hypothetical protein